ncbi:M56 family metallopeptidase [Paenibacillus alginolyticus]|nr:M56 family metallopeptidase [Paenibacillus alginolyticus]MEC0144648.1 M56 family metallopeptidase [Paenibacillus alginolyticus]
MAIIVMGIFILVQMGLYLVHEIWDVEFKLNLFQYCLTALKEKTWSHSGVKLLFNLLIIYTATNILFKLVKQNYQTYKWEQIFDRRKHKKLTKRLNNKYRSWNTEILVVQDNSFIALAIGLIKPRIVISTKVLEIFEEEEVKAILLHERFHCMNYDPLKVFITSLISVGMNYVPVIKNLFYYYKTWTELIADYYAVKEMGSSYTLGKVLLRLTKIVPIKHLQFGVSFSDVSINYRIMQVIEPEHKIRVPAIYFKSVMFTFLILLIMIGTVLGGCS